VVVVAGAIALPTLSSAVGLYDHVFHWGKVVHAVDGFCVTFAFGLLLLGWRDYEQIGLTDELVGLLTVCAGVFFGVVWEVVEFIRDWVAYSDLEKSNSDTMTDFLCNHVMAVIAMLIVMRMYSRGSSPEDRRAVGQTAEWLVDGPSRVLNRHGFAMATIGVVVIAAAVAALWFTGRPVPGIPIP
jgi:hypothetical protein